MSHPAEVFWYRCDETSGLSVVDSSGNGYTGTPTEDVSNWTVAGKINGGFELDGVSERFTRAALAEMSTAGPLSISFWAFPGTVDSNYRCPLGHTLSTSPMDRWGVTFILSGSKISLSFRAAYDATDVWKSGIVPAGQWSHLCGVWSGSGWTVYINGVSISEGGAASLGNTLILSVGGRVDGAAAKFYSGKLDDVRGYDFALSEDEMLALYNEGNGTEESLDNLMGSSSSPSSSTSSSSSSSSLSSTSSSGSSECSEESSLSSPSSVLSSSCSSESSSSESTSISSTSSSSPSSSISSGSSSISSSSKSSSVSSVSSESSLSSSSSTGMKEYPASKTITKVGPNGKTVAKVGPSSVIVSVPSSIPKYSSIPEYKSCH